MQEKGVLNIGVFNPNQIKSVDNRGTFDLNDANIYHQEQITEWEMDVANDMRKRLGVEGAIYELEYTKRLFDRNLHNEHPSVVEMTKKRIASLDRQIEWLRGGNQLTVTQKPVDQSMNVKAREYFGTTTNINEAGYIMQDGSMLDFSGKKFGGQAGHRVIDHREISSAFEEDGFNVEMTDFIDNGNIRFIPESKTFLMSRMPTPQQIEQIQKISDRVNGEVIIECVEQAKEWGSDYGFYNEYDKGTDFKTIKRDITSFFKTGKVSDTNKFLQATYVDEIDSSELYNRLPKDLKDAVDFIYTTEPVSELTGDEFQKDDKPLTDKVVDFYKENYNGQVERTDIGVVKLDKEGVKDSLGHGIGRKKAIAYASVPEVIKNGFIFDKQTNWKGRGYDTIVLLAPIKIGEDNYVCEVVIKQGSERQGFYLHEVELSKKFADVFKTVNDSTPANSKLIIAQKIAEVNSDGKFYQKAYVSMKGELVGDYLDADEFEGTGEGAMAHGWGNYLLKDRKTNKIRYFDRWNERKVFYKGDIVDFDSIRDLVEYYIDKKQEENLSDKELLELINAEIERFEKHLNDEKQTMERLKKENSLNEKLLDDIKEYAKNDGNVGYEIRERIYNNLDNRAIYTNWFRAYKSYLRINKNIEQLKKLSSINISDIEIKNSSAQYEAEVPEDKFLLDEDKFFNKQSKIVRDAINEIAQEMGNRFNEAKLRKLTNDTYSGSGSENWKTYYGKRAFFLGKQKALEYIHNDQEGTLEQELTDFINNLDFNDISDSRDFSDYTGREIYKELDNYYGSQKRVSKLLEKHGIKGIKYDGERDGIGYVIFKGADAPITRRLLQIVNQEPRQKKVVKGTFSAFKKSIGITKDADTSTYSHEFAHFWVDSIWEHIESGNASEEYIKRFEGVMKYIGAERGKKLTKAQHEKFARAYEKYLFTAEVPRGVNPDVFDDYEKFIRDVYDDITQIDTRAGEKYEPITEEVYNFFNSMTRDPLPKPRYLAEDGTVNPLDLSFGFPQDRLRRPLREQTHFVTSAPITPIKKTTLSDRLFKWGERWDCKSLGFILRFPSGPAPPSASRTNPLRDFGPYHSHKKNDPFGSSF